MCAHLTQDHRGKGNINEVVNLVENIIISIDNRLLTLIALNAKMSTVVVNQFIKSIKEGDMTQQTVQEAKFWLDIEGTLKPWNQETITTEQIADLGGWDPKEGVILIDEDNDERTLQPGEVIKLRPGIAFSKDIRFKRG